MIDQDQPQPVTVGCLEAFLWLAASIAVAVVLYFEFEFDHEDPGEDFGLIEATLFLIDEHPLTGRPVDLISVVWPDLENGNRKIRIELFADGRWRFIREFFSKDSDLLLVGINVFCGMKALPAPPWGDRNSRVSTGYFGKRLPEYRFRVWMDGHPVGVATAKRNSKALPKTGPVNR